MAIVLESLNRQGKVVALHKFAQTRLRLGRAYDNDLIVSDAYVNPHHAELTLQQDGRWRLQDLASENGCFDANEQRVHHLEIASGDSFFLAEQKFRLVDATQPVEATLPLDKVAARLNRLGHPVQLLCWFVLVFLFDLAEYWFHNGAEEELRWQQQLIQLPLYGLALTVWPVLLMVWARFNHRHGYFRAQLAMMLLAVLGLNLWELVGPLLRFNLNGASWLFWIDQAVVAAVLFALLLGNFTLALQQNKTRRIALSAALVLLFSGQSLVPRIWHDEQPRLAPVYDSTLLPRSYYLGITHSNEQAIEQSQVLFQQANELRHEEIK